MPGRRVVEGVGRPALVVGVAAGDHHEVVGDAVDVAAVAVAVAHPHHDGLAGVELAVDVGASLCGAGRVGHHRPVGVLAGGHLDPAVRPEHGGARLRRHRPGREEAGRPARGEAVAADDLAVPGHLQVHRPAARRLLLGGLRGGPTAGFLQRDDHLRQGGPVRAVPGVAEPAGVGARPVDRGQRRGRPGPHVLDRACTGPQVGREGAQGVDVGAEELGRCGGHAARVRPAGPCAQRHRPRNVPLPSQMAAQVRSGGAFAPQEGGQVRSGGALGPQEAAQVRSGGAFAPQEGGQVRSGGVLAPREGGQVRRGAAWDHHLRTGPGDDGAR